MNLLSQAQDQAVVLVIDDDTDVIAGMAKTLSAAGYDTHCRRDAEGALECIRDVRPDLVILDVNLSDRSQPGQTGLQLCDRIREEEGLADVPVMFLSATQIPDIIRRAHGAGGAYYLRKPFDSEVLLELIDKALWSTNLVAN